MRERTWVRSQVPLIFPYFFSLKCDQVLWSFHGLPYAPQSSMPLGQLRSIKGLDLWNMVSSSQCSHMLPEKVNKASIDGPELLGLHPLGLLSPIPFLFLLFIFICLFNFHFIFSNQYFHNK